MKAKVAAAVEAAAGALCCGPPKAASKLMHSMRRLAEGSMTET